MLKEIKPSKPTCRLDIRLNKLMIWFQEKEYYDEYQTFISKIFNFLLLSSFSILREITKSLLNKLWLLEIVQRLLRLQLFSFIAQINFNWWTLE